VVGVSIYGKHLERKKAEFLNGIFAEMQQEIS